MCAGEPAFSQAVGLGHGSEPGKALVCDPGYISIPSDLIATKPGHFLYVLKFSSGTDLLETCPYISSSGEIYYLKLMRAWWNIQVSSTLTGQKIVNNKFIGSAPAACPETNKFIFGVYTQTVLGNSPPESAVISWLRQVLK